MSLSFRNLILLGLLVLMVSSLSISSHAHRSQNQHMLKVQESTSRFSHQQTNNFAQTILGNIDTIAKSVNKDAPSIISTQNLATFAYDRSTCESLNDDQKKQISDKVKSTQDSLTDFKSNVKDNKLLVDADNSIWYLNTVQRLTSSNCGDFTKYLLIGSTPYQTNINTDKAWVLGGISMDSLVKDYINRITVNNNVTNCGNDSPFWNGAKCIACNDPKPIFNLSSSECTACPSGQVFDIKTKVCVDGGAPTPAPKSWKPNPKAEPNVLVPSGAPDGALRAYLDSGNDLCPEDKPNVKDNSCIACPSDKAYFNIVSNQCEPCQDGSVFSSETHQCSPVEKSWKPNASAEPNVLVPADAPQDALKTYLGSGKDECPTDKPNVKDNVCLACPADKPYFNVVSKGCEACPEGSVFSSDTHQCKAAEKIYKPNPSAEPNVLVPSDAPDGALRAYLDSGKDVCPEDQPNVKDNACLACPADKPYFNVVSKACEPCPEGATFNSTSHQCITPPKEYKPNAAAEANALVPDDAPADALPTYMNTGKEPCPADKPFVKDGGCIPCPADKPYFNIIAKECQQCPQDFVYDSNTHKCIPGKPIATDVPKQNSRLVMNDNSTNADWDNYVEENKNKILCPTDKPFWNGTECIPCEDLFNIITKKCVSCEPGLALHTDTHKCDPADPIEPSLKDLFNAIF